MYATAFKNLMECMTSEWHIDAVIGTVSFILTIYSLKNIVSVKKAVSISRGEYDFRLHADETIEEIDDLIDLINECSNEEDVRRKVYGEYKRFADLTDYDEIIKYKSPRRFKTIEEFVKRVSDEYVTPETGNKKIKKPLSKAGLILELTAIKNALRMKR